MTRPRSNAFALVFLSVFSGTVLVGACGGGESASTEPGTTGGKKAGSSGKGGKGGSAGKAGSAGKGGSEQAGAGGSEAGAGGAAAGSGNAGQGGAVAGSAGAGGAVAGQGGVGGSAGGSAGGAASGGAGAGAGSGGSSAAGSPSAGSAGSGAGGPAGQSGSGQGASAGSGNDGGLDPDAACVAQSAQASLQKKPVDIIFVIDNSGSMTNEIQGVQTNISKNFADIIGASGLDYRVIMISRHGTASSGQSICVSAPLSGTDCSPVPGKPANTEKFRHYSVEISSINSLSQIIATYAKKDEHGLAPTGWKDWLRPEALKVFVEITDDNQNSTDPDKSTIFTAATFDVALLALPGGQFGTAQKRNYIFHSIVGVKEKSPPGAYGPDEPVVSGKCSSAVNSGSQYQNLSKLTGGLRFPLCDFDAYDVVFQTIAKGVVEGSVVECAFPIPDAPDGQTIDPSTVEIGYTPGSGGAEQKLKQVPSELDCDWASFYIQNQTVNLCPVVCGDVQSDPKAKLQILYGCGKV